jgi:hypothetical protein
MFSDPLIARMASFVSGIGIEVRVEDLPGSTFLPGLDIRFGALVVDGCSIPATCSMRPATSPSPPWRSGSGRNSSRPSATR